MAVREKEMVQLWNMHSEDYSEKWKQGVLTIKANSFVEMSRHDASLFRGTYGGQYTDGTNKGKDKVKMLSIKPLPKKSNVPTPEPEKFLSMLDGKEFDTKEELDNHLKQFEHKTVKDEELDKKINFIECPICKKRVKGKLGLEVHLKTCKG